MYGYHLNSTSKPLLHYSSSAQAHNPASRAVDVNQVVRRPGGKPWNGRHVAHQRVQEASAAAGFDVADREREARGSALLGGVVRERVLCLGHADGQLSEALLRVQRDGGLLWLGPNKSAPCTRPSFLRKGFCDTRCGHTLGVRGTDGGHNTEKGSELGRTAAGRYSTPSALYTSFAMISIFSLIDRLSGYRNLKSESTLQASSTALPSSTAPAPPSA
jgi:hypothetical protein